MTAQLCTVLIGLTPVDGEHPWVITDRSVEVESGSMPVDLAGWWDEQVDGALLPRGWERISRWRLCGDFAEAHLRRDVEVRSARVDTAFHPLRARHKAESVRALSEVFTRMREDVQARKDAGAKRLVAARWDGVVAGVVLDQNMATASEVALRVSRALKPPKRAGDTLDEYDPNVMLNWLTINSDIAGKNINSYTEGQLAEADDSERVDDPVGHVFDILMTTGVAGLAQRMVTMSAGFGAHDAAERIGGASKVWHVNSSNPRSSHARLNGQARAMGQAFSNGMMWPGDPSGGAHENARCKCSLTLIR